MKWAPNWSCAPATPRQHDQSDQEHERAGRLQQAVCCLRTLHWSLDLDRQARKKRPLCRRLSNTLDKASARISRVVNFQPFCIPAADLGKYPSVQSPLYSLGEHLVGKPAPCPSIGMQLTEEDSPAAIGVPYVRNGWPA